jgi:hypothetical protein
LVASHVNNGTTLSLYFFNLTETATTSVIVITHFAHNLDNLLRRRMVLGAAVGLGFFDRCTSKLYLDPATTVIREEGSTLFSLAQLHMKIDANGNEVVSEALGRTEQSKSSRGLAWHAIGPLRKSLRNIPGIIFSFLVIQEHRKLSALLLRPRFTSSRPLFSCQRSIYYR